MKLSVEFQESIQSFSADFGEVNNISDGGYERGYAEGYETGYSVGYEDNAEVPNMLIDRSIKSITTNATNIGHGAFNGCTELVEVNIPFATVLNMLAFGSCFMLPQIYAPNVTTLYSKIFEYCEVLKTADFPLLTSIASQAFYANHSLIAVILRNNRVCTLKAADAFSLCYHILGTQDSKYNPDGLKDGYIYVPAALVENYKAATNWSKYADQIRAIEDYPDITGG